MTTVIEERFEIRRRLGAGGMGEVFEAYDRERDEVVALKTLRYPNPAALYQFKREFRSLQDVSHPNLVSLYELVVEEEEWFFTMELVDGESLKDYAYSLEETLPLGVQAGERPPLHPERLLSAIRQLASGVQAVHDAGRLHRDLKPSNVMVNRQGRVVILDFGVATELRPMNLHSIDTGIAGTAAYMAPEQARGEPAQPASDWYAVGVILFEILTGRWPFTGSLARILIDKQFQRAPSPASLVPGLPDELVELCNALLETEPEDRPSGAEILERLGAEEVSGVVGTASAGESMLVGRRAELAELDDAFARTQDGEGVLLHVHGPSGIGKTALVQHFLHSLKKRTQAVILSGRCYEHEMVPYKALDGVVDSLSRYLRSLGGGMVEELLPRRIDALARLFPVLLRVDAVALRAESAADSGRPAADMEHPDRPHLRRQALGALRDLLERIVTLQPVVLHVDDLQWADAESAAMLRDILVPPGAPPALLVTSFRSEELESRPFLRQLLRQTESPTSRRLDLGALAEEAAREYVEQALGSRPGTEYVVELIVQEARGVPFFLEQLTRHATSSRSGVSAGLGLMEMLEERLQLLPHGGLALLNVLAAAGRPVAVAWATRAAGFDGDQRRLLAALKAACLVRASSPDQQVELYHDRIRDALLARLSRVEARRVHGRLLAALEESGVDDPEMLLDQATRAGDRAKASKWARRAAEKSSAALAYERAAELYRRALELAGDGAQEPELRDRLAAALAFGGRTREAADLHLELSHVHTGSKALEYRRAAAMEYLISGYVDRGLEVAGALLAALGLKLPVGRFRTLATFFLLRSRLRLSRLRFEARGEGSVGAEELLRVDTCWALTSGLLMSDSMRAAVFQSRHLLAALEVGEPHRVARALAMEAGFRAVPGRSGRRRAEAMYERAAEMARQLDDAYVAALAVLMRGVILYLNGEWSSALLTCDQAETMFLDGPGCAVWEVVTARRFALASLASLGRVDELSRRLPVQLEEAVARGNVYGTNELRTRLNLYWLARDDADQAEREIAAAASTWTRRGFRLSHHSILQARVQVHLYRGRGNDALAAVEEEWPRLESSLLLRIQAMRIEATILRARALLAAAAETRGRPRRRLARRAEGLARRARREGLSYGRALADLVDAGAARLSGLPQEARRALERAGPGFESCAMLLHVSACRRCLGEVLGGAEGEEVRRRAEAEMAEVGVRNPRRLARMLAPGFR